MVIKVVPLGAGQDVGRSCILLSINNKNIMLDCGMHMGYQVFPQRKRADFFRITDDILIFLTFQIRMISMECWMPLLFPIFTWTIVGRCLISRKFVDIMDLYI
jgi:predicted metal-dependent RNase